MVWRKAFTLTALLAALNGCTEKEKGPFFDLLDGVADVRTVEYFGFSEAYEGVVDCWILDLPEVGIKDDLRVRIFINPNSTYNVEVSSRLEFLKRVYDRSSGELVKESFWKGNVGEFDGYELSGDLVPEFTRRLLDQAIGFRRSDDFEVAIFKSMAERNRRAEERAGVYEKAEGDEELNPKHRVVYVLTNEFKNGL